MKKHTFTLSERHMLTEELNLATEQVTNVAGKLINGTGFDGISDLVTTLPILTEATERGLYGKRFHDVKIFHSHSSGFVPPSPDPRDIMLSNMIPLAEEEMRNGDNGARDYLRLVKDIDKYGKRCKDDNLDGKTN